MYARGMSTQEISSHLEELYGVGVSAEFISHVTESVLEDVKEWHNRPLDVCYPVVFFDALRVNRSGTRVKAMAVHLALGIRTDGSRDVLGVWFNENEGVSFWASVFTELKNRGVEDILIAVTDGLKGMNGGIDYGISGYSAPDLHSSFDSKLNGLHQLERYERGNPCA